MSKKLHAGFGPGTHFSVPFQGGIKVNGVVLNAVPERIYCTMLGPAVRIDDGATWEPGSESHHVVDDYALYDGSWDVGKTVPDFVSEHPPRMKSISKTSGDVLVSYAPATLDVADIDPVRAHERIEFDAAYTFVAPDIATFVESLRQTFGIEALAADGSHMNGNDSRRDRLTVAAIRRACSDPTRRLTFDFNLNCKSKRKATALESALYNEGANFRTTGGGLFRDVTVTVSANHIPAYPIIAPEVARYRSLANEHGATFDGFGALAN